MAGAQILSRTTFLLLIVFFSLQGFCYIPASPTNSTDDAVEGGLNVTDISQIHLQWYPSGSYWQSVSYQLVGEESQGISQGALVHFSEEHVNDSTPASSSPWIALVACDSNATNADQVIDIFTLARDKGAVAALLYSLYSQACVINAEYADPETYDQVFDIFATQSLAQSNLVEYQFGQIGGSNSSYDWYNSQLLNESNAAINQSIYDGYVGSTGYLLATLHAYNATATSNDTATDNTPTGTPGASSNGGGSQSSTAMVILYAITGCVSATFIIVIALGALRAVRHPERYGTRRIGAGGIIVEQSRARGLGRAIVDSFPIVRFGGATVPRRQPKDLEARDLDGKTEAGLEEMPPIAMRRLPASDSRSVVDEEERHNGDIIAGSSRHPTSGEEVMPEAIGRETCPICIVDFEEGDALRQLPCEGQHLFHRDCVDPWLLELSSSCPICRQDFQALQSMLTDEEESEEGNTHRASAVSMNRRQRFSRYIKFAVRRRRRASSEHEREESISDEDEPQPQDEAEASSSRVPTSHPSPSSGSGPPHLPRMDL